MRNITVKTDNLDRLEASYMRAKTTHSDLKIVVVEGLSGTGKTKAAQRVATTQGQVYVECSCAWTLTAMLKEIAEKLGLPRPNDRAKLDNSIRDTLLDNPRALFLDEADQLFLLPTRREVRVAFETLRKFHDQAGSPLIFLGEETLGTSMAQWERQISRVRETVRFEQLVFEDAVAIAKANCEIEVAGDLLEELHRQCRGSFRRFANGLEALEELAQRMGKDAVTLADWSATGREFFTSKKRK